MRCNSFWCCIARWSSVENDLPRGAAAGSCHGGCCCCCSGCGVHSWCERGGGRCGWRRCCGDRLSPQGCASKRTASLAPAELPSVCTWTSVPLLAWRSGGGGAGGCAARVRSFSPAPAGRLFVRLSGLSAERHATRCAGTGAYCVGTGGCDISSETMSLGALTKLLAPVRPPLPPRPPPSPLPKQPPPPKPPSPPPPPAAHTDAGTAPVHEGASAPASASASPLALAPMLASTLTSMLAPMLLAGKNSGSVSGLLPSRLFSRYFCRWLLTW
mmetsp:Transcript_39666/g.118039  ORF Transcript_39666/g.118039 Transcript_39666/m.118039 type:complete len:271 (-) Transcript_39666:667-1479(-)